MNPSAIMPIGYGKPSHRPGDVVVSADGRKAYRVAKDGSRQTMPADEAAPYIARAIASVRTPQPPPATEVVPCPEAPALSVCEPSVPSGGEIGPRSTLRPATFAALIAAAAVLGGGRR